MRVGYETVERNYDVVCDLLNGIIFSDLEWPVA